VKPTLKTGLLFWKRHPHGAVFLLYVALAVLNTFPLIVHLGDSVFGPPEDGLNFVWNFWWVKTALLELGQSFYHTDFIFHPEGTTLWFHTLSIANALFSLPLQTLFGTYAAYNIVVLTIFALRGFGMYLLTWHVVRSRPAAILAGLAYSFGPFFVHKSLHHLSLSSAHFIPFVLLFFLRTMESRKMRDGLLLGIFTALAALSSWVYLLQLFVGFCFLIPFLLVTNRSALLHRSTLRHLGLSLLVFAAFAGPFLYPLLRELLAGSEYVARSISYHAAIDLASLFVPSELHPLDRLIGNRFLSYYNGLDGNNWELTYYAGVTMIGLIVLAAARGKLRGYRLWIAWSLFFFVLAMGDSLHIAGTDTGIPLPHALLSTVPPLSLLRAPGRYFALALIGMYILAARGFVVAVNSARRLGERRGHARGWGMAASGILLALAAGELVSFPLERTPVDTPPAYETIRADTSCEAVLEIPLSGYRSHYKDAAYLRVLGGAYRQTHYLRYENLAMFRQIEHGKKLLGGYLARMPLRSRSRADLVLQLGEGRLPENKRPRALLQLENLGVKCVVVHERFLAESPDWTTAEVNSLLKWLEGHARGYRDTVSATRVYRIVPSGCARQTTGGAVREPPRDTGGSNDAEDTR
jgi:hypothetical protein